MNTPDVTKIQGGAAGVFIAIVLAGPQAGYDAAHLDVLVAVSGLVAIVAIVADAMIRRGRAGLAEQQEHTEALENL